MRFKKSFLIKNDFVKQTYSQKQQKFKCYVKYTKLQRNGI